MTEENKRLINALLDKLEGELNKISVAAGYLTFEEFKNNNYTNAKKTIH